jgi:hypothetical protein
LPNWITGKYGDHIELRRGTLLLGQTRQTGSGKITGLGVGSVIDNHWQDGQLNLKTDN